jgi:hypothetical protein
MTKCVKATMMTSYVSDLMKLQLSKKLELQFSVYGECVHKVTVKSCSCIT